MNALRATRQAAVAASSTENSVRALPGLDLHATRLGTAGVVAVDGGVDAGVSSEITGALIELIRAGTTAVAVDLSGVTETDYSLFGSLAKAHTAVKTAGGHLYLVVGDDRMLSWLRLSGFDRIAPVFLTRAYRDLIALPAGARVTARLARRSRVVDLHGAAQHRPRAPQPEA